MASDNIQHSSAQQFLQQAFTASEGGKRRVVIDNTDLTQPEGISWHVETTLQKLKRLVSFSHVTKQQHTTFVNTLRAIAHKTQSSADAQAADALEQEINHAPKLTRAKTAISVAHSVWSTTQQLAEEPPPINQTVTALRPPPQNPSTHTELGHSTPSTPRSLAERQVSVDANDTAQLASDLAGELDTLNKGPDVTNSPEVNRQWLADAQSRVDTLVQRVPDREPPEAVSEYVTALTNILRHWEQALTPVAPVNTPPPQSETSSPRPSETQANPQATATLGTTFNELVGQSEFQQLLREHPAEVAPVIERIFNLAEQIERGLTASPPPAAQQIEQLKGQVDIAQTELALALGQQTGSDLKVTSVLDAFAPFVAAIDARIERIEVAAPTPRHEPLFHSAQELIDQTKAQSQAGVDLDTVQVDLADLGGIHPSLEINGRALHSLVDPETGKLPLRTALIAYGLGYPDQRAGLHAQKVYPFPEVLASWYGFYSAPGTRQGVEDLRFSETVIGKAIHRDFPSHRGPVPPATVKSEAPLVNVDYRDIDYDTLKVLALTAYPVFDQLPADVRDRIISRFVTTALASKDPRIGNVIHQLAIFASDLQASGVHSRELGEKTATQLGKLLDLHREVPYATHPRLANLLTDGRPDEVRRLHIYTPGPVYNHPQTPSLNDEETPESIRKAEDIEHRRKLLTLDPNNTIVIGNGGAGAAGLLQHLATRYQESVSKTGDTPPTIVWRFGDSNQNFKAINHEDLAITYEPPEEQRLKAEGKLAQVRPAFFNHLELAAPPNPPFTISSGVKGGRADDPVAVLAEIVTKSIGLQEHGLPKKTYFSRYNASAVGTKDEILFRKAIKTVLSGPNRETVLDKAGVVNRAGKSEEQIEAALYSEWIKHVVTDRSASVIKAAKESKEKGYFHLNDRAILLQEEIPQRNWLTNTANDPKALLLNPAQIVSAKHGLESPQTVKFVNWLTSPEGQAAVESFRLRKGDGSTQTYASFGNVTFGQLLANVPALERGGLIDNIWRPHADAY